MSKVFLFGPLILTNNWGFRTNILNISSDRNFPYIHNIVMEIRSVSLSTLIPSLEMINIIRSITTQFMSCIINGTQDQIGLQFD